VHGASRREFDAMPRCGAATATMTAGYGG